MQTEVITDTDRIEFLERGHCVLCLCVFDGKRLSGHAFQVDGHQDAPELLTAREAIDDALRKERANGTANRK